jgi:hypothetical protein
VIWESERDGGDCVHFAHGIDELNRWRYEAIDVYADPRWRDDSDEPDEALTEWLRECARSATNVTAAGWGDDWAGYSAIKARRMFQAGR